MKRLAVMAVAGVLAFGLAGCSSKGSHKNGANMKAHANGVGGAEGFEGDPWGRSEEELLSTRTYYFGFDKFDVAEKDVPAVNAQARFLLKNPNARIRVEGHTDERGSREYNVALGERRANAVKDILSARGVPAEQVAVVSYGKEKPAELGHDEEAWRLNRRAIVVVEQE